jgi:hypothetical protein
MNLNVIVFWGSLFALSCNTSTRFSNQQKNKEQYTKEGGGTNKVQAESNTFTLHLNPTPGSQYHYTISNEYNIEVEANGKKTNSLSNSDVGVTYMLWAPW